MLADLVERADSESDYMDVCQRPCRLEQSGQLTMVEVVVEGNVCWHFHLSSCVSFPSCPRGTLRSDCD